MKKIMIIGHARHGKDTVAELLRDNHGFNLTPASWTFADEVMRNQMGYTSTQECFDDRINHRGMWGDAIAEYNTPDAAALAKRVMQDSDLYVGCRRLREYAGCVDMFDHVVWVDRSLLLPDEPNTSMQLRYTHARHWIDNNGDLKNLRDRVAQFVESTSAKS